MLYEFLLLWLIGIVACAYAFYQTRNAFFLGFLSILLMTLGAMVTFEGVQFQSIVTVNGVATKALITVNDAAVLFIGWAATGLGVMGLIITLFVVLKGLLTSQR